MVPSEVGFPSEPELSKDVQNEEILGYTRSHVRKPIIYNEFTHSVTGQRFRSPVPKSRTNGIQERHPKNFNNPSSRKTPSLGNMVDSSMETDENKSQAERYEYTINSALPQFMSNSGKTPMDAYRPTVINLVLILSNGNGDGSNLPSANSEMTADKSATTYPYFKLDHKIDPRNVYSSRL
ncbi:unnamed protein product [Orchesella dallaii]|uniref:Uncharacterized protein n=1 Tax=Orchesella dallaii TaxID=48710 RepID=A0ABP1RDR8_9HEXA